MTIGDVFSRAWELWRRDVGWLILAGLVVGVIVGVIVAVAAAIAVGMAAVSIGGIAIGTSGNVKSITGLSAGSLIGAVFVFLIGYLIASVLAMVFYGGLYEMVIGAAREDRGVNFGDLFSGFHKFGSFVVYWLVIVGISIVCGLVALIPVIGIIVDVVFLVWLMTTWLYVLPLIADRGLSFTDAARASNQMVKSVGWWKTFAIIIVLGVAFAVIGAIISLIGRASSVLSTVLMIIFEVLAGPFAICYVSTMYLKTGGETAGVAAAAPPAGGFGMPLPPPPGSGTAYLPPPPLLPGQSYQPGAPPSVTAPPVAPPPPAPPPIAASPAAEPSPAAPPPSEGAAMAPEAAAPAPAEGPEVWKAAADPLATTESVPSPVAEAAPVPPPPAGVAPAVETAPAPSPVAEPAPPVETAPAAEPSPAADTALTESAAADTAVTEAPPAPGPAAPEPPAPPTAPEQG